jgi:signal peptidase I
MKLLEKFIKNNNTREWVESAIVALAFAIFLRSFFFQIYKIPTKSMENTLKPGDKIFVSRIIYGPKILFTNLRLPGLRKPVRGEIVVFIPPNDRKKAYIKRLIGLPGEKILIKDGNIYVNGKIITDPRIARNFYYNQGDYAQEGREIIVPENKYFFLGDNSMQSLDSRFWGFAAHNDVVGKAIFIWWPPQRIRMLE